VEIQPQWVVTPGKQQNIEKRKNTPVELWQS
jgi:hypothetical protein